MTPFLGLAKSLVIRYIHCRPSVIGQIGVAIAHCGGGAVVCEVHTKSRVLFAA